MATSSTDSLTSSYLSRGSCYTNATSIHTLSADTDGLHRLLASRDITTQVIAGAFEEFAWRGVLRGTRVRDWCEGLRTLLDELHIVQDLHTALQTPSIIALFPFLSLITTPSQIQAHFFYPPPTLSVFQLANLDRDTLVDALLSLLEGSDFMCEDDLVAPVTELVLEYIGTVWRRMIVDDVSRLGMADGIAKALVELEFELQCQGNKSSLRTLIFPIVRRIRFDLGFVTSFQLVSRLKSHLDHSGTNPTCNPHHIIAAWAIRRLNAGLSPQKVHDDLVFIRERVRNDTVQVVFEDVLAQLGLEQRDSQDMPVDTMEQYSFGRVVPPTSPPPSASPKTPTPPSSSSKKVFSLFSSGKKATSRKSLVPTSKSNTSLLGLPAGFDPSRRPSLPAVFSTHQPLFQFSPSPAPAPSPLKSTSLTSFQSATSTDSGISTSIVSRAPSLATDLLSQIMTFSDATDVRLILLDYVVETRYRLHIGGGCDWYFGTGRESAASTLDMLEGRLVGKRDVMDLATVFGDIRARFSIPAPGSPIRQHTRAAIGRRQRLGRESSEGTRTRTDSAEGVQWRDMVGNGRETPKDMPESHSRGVSFELDSYYHRHIEEEEEEEVIYDSGTSMAETVKERRRKSAGAVSQFSLSSCLSTNVQPDAEMGNGSGGSGEGGQRGSFASNYTYTFSIREAKVGHAQEARRLPSPPKDVGAGDEVSEISHDTHDTHTTHDSNSGSSSIGSHTPLAGSPYRTFFPSRSESSLVSPHSHSSSSHSSHSQHRHMLSSTNGRGSANGTTSSPTSVKHLGIPPSIRSIRSIRSNRSTNTRASSPAGSFHSLLSALDLETRLPIDYDHIDLSLLQLFPDPSTTPKSSPLSLDNTSTPVRTPISSDTDKARKLKQKQNRQFVVVDLELSPERQYADDLTTPSLGTASGDEYDFPVELSTPGLGHDSPLPSSTPNFHPRAGPGGPRRRYTSDHSRSLDPIDEHVPSKRGDLPLAQLLALFTGPPAIGNGMAGTKVGTRPEDVTKAVEAFVAGEMGYAEEMGSGWDGEDQRRVVWLLRQIAAMIQDPALQYPIHQQILYLARHPPTPSSSNRTSLASTNSTSTSASRYPATPAMSSVAQAQAQQSYLYPPTPISSASVSAPALYTPPSVHNQGYSLGVTYGSTPDLRDSAEVDSQRPRSAAVASGKAFGIGLGLGLGLGKKGDRSSMLSTFGVGLGLHEGQEGLRGYELL